MGPLAGACARCCSRTRLTSPPSPRRRPSRAMTSTERPTRSPSPEVLEGRRQERHSRRLHQDLEVNDARDTRHHAAEVLVQQPPGPTRRRSSRRFRPTAATLRPLSSTQHHVFSPATRRSRRSRRIDKAWHHHDSEAGLIAIRDNERRDPRRDAARVSFGLALPIAERRRPLGERDWPSAGVVQPTPVHGDWKVGGVTVPSING